MSANKDSDSDSNKSKKVSSEKSADVRESGIKRRRGKRGRKFESSEEDDAVEEGSDEDYVDGSAPKKVKVLQSDSKKPHTSSSGVKRSRSTATRGRGVKTSRASSSRSHGGKSARGGKRAAARRNVGVWRGIFYHGAGTYVPCEDSEAEEVDSEEEELAEERFRAHIRDFEENEQNFKYNFKTIKRHLTGYGKEVKELFGTSKTYRTMNWDELEDAEGLELEGASIGRQKNLDFEDNIFHAMDGKKIGRQKLLVKNYEDDFLQKRKEQIATQGADAFFEEMRKKKNRSVAQVKQWLFRRSRGSTFNDEVYLPWRTLLATIGFLRYFNHLCKMFNMLGSKAENVAERNLHPEFNKYKEKDLKDEQQRVRELIGESLDLAMELFKELRKSRFDWCCHVLGYLPYNFDGLPRKALETTEKFKSDMCVLDVDVTSPEFGCIRYFNGIIASIIGKNVDHRFSIDPKVIWEFIKTVKGARLIYTVAFIFRMCLCRLCKILNDRLVRIPRIDWSSAEIEGFYIPRREITTGEHGNKYGDVAVLPDDNIGPCNLKDVREDYSVYHHLQSLLTHCGSKGERNQVRATEGRLNNKELFGGFLAQVHNTGSPFAEPMEPDERLPCARLFRVSEEEEENEEEGFFFGGSSGQQSKRKKGASKGKKHSSVDRTGKDKYVAIHRLPIGSWVNVSTMKYRKHFSSSCNVRTLINNLEEIVRIMCCLKAKNASTRLEPPLKYESLLLELLYSSMPGCSCTPKFNKPWHETKLYHYDSMRPYLTCVGDCQQMGCSQRFHCFIYYEPWKWTDSFRMYFIRDDCAGRKYMLHSAIHHKKITDAYKGKTAAEVLEEKIEELTDDGDYDESRYCFKDEKDRVEYRNHPITCPKSVMDGMIVAPKVHIDEEVIPLFMEKFGGTIRNKSALFMTATNPIFETTFDEVEEVDYSICELDGDPDVGHLLEISKDGELIGVKGKHRDSVVDDGNNGGDDYLNEEPCSSGMLQKSPSNTQSSEVNIGGDLNKSNDILEDNSEMLEVRTVVIDSIGDETFVKDIALSREDSEVSTPHLVIAETGSMDDISASREGSDMATPGLEGKDGNEAVIVTEKSLLHGGLASGVLPTDARKDNPLKDDGKTKIRRSHVVSDTTKGPLEKSLHSKEKTSEQKAQLQTRKGQQFVESKGEEVPIVSARDRGIHSAIDAVVAHGKKKKKGRRRILVQDSPNISSFSQSQNTPDISQYSNSDYKQDAPVPSRFESDAAIEVENDLSGPSDVNKDDISNESNFVIAGISVDNDVLSMLQSGETASVLINVGSSQLANKEDELFKEPGDDLFEDDIESPSSIFDDPMNIHNLAGLIPQAQLLVQFPAVNYDVAQALSARQEIIGKRMHDDCELLATVDIPKEYKGWCPSSPDHLIFVEEKLTQICNDHHLTVANVKGLHSGAYMNAQQQGIKEEEKMTVQKFFEEAANVSEEKVDVVFNRGQKACNANWSRSSIWTEVWNQYKSGFPARSCLQLVESEIKTCSTGRDEHPLNCNDVEMISPDVIKFEIPGETESFHIFRGCLSDDEYQQTKACTLADNCLPQGLKMLPPSNLPRATWKEASWKVRVETLWKGDFEFIIPITCGIDGRLVRLFNPMSAKPWMSYLLTNNHDLGGALLDLLMGMLAANYKVGIGGFMSMAGFRARHLRVQIAPKFDRLCQIVEIMTDSKSTTFSHHALLTNFLVGEDDDFCREHFYLLEFDLPSKVNKSMAYATACALLDLDDDNKDITVKSIPIYQCPELPSGYMVAIHLINLVFGKINTRKLFVHLGNNDQKVELKQNFAHGFATSEFEQVLSSVAIKEVHQALSVFETYPYNTKAQKRYVNSFVKQKVTFTSGCYKDCRINFSTSASNKSDPLHLSCIACCRPFHVECCPVVIEPNILSSRGRAKKKDKLYFRCFDCLSGDLSARDWKLSASDYYYRIELSKLALAGQTENPNKSANLDVGGKLFLRMPVECLLNTARCSQLKEPMEASSIDHYLGKILFNHGSLYQKNYTFGFLTLADTENFILANGQLNGDCPFEKMVFLAKAVQRYVDIGKNLIFVFLELEKGHYVLTFIYPTSGKIVTWDPITNFDDWDCYQKMGQISHSVGFLCALGSCLSKPQGKKSIQWICCVDNYFPTCGTVYLSAGAIIDWVESITSGTEPMTAGDESFKSMLALVVRNEISKCITPEPTDRKSCWIKSGIESPKYRAGQIVSKWRFMKKTADLKVEFPKK